MSVINGNKVVIEVGSTCLKDFLQTDKISNILFQANFLSSIGDILSEGREPGARCVPVYGLKLLIATAIHSISEYGYVSKAKAEEMMLQATSYHTLNLVEGDKYHGIAPYKPTKEEYEEAELVIEYVKTINTDNDYNYNLHKIANAEVTSLRYVGYAVSMVPFYRKAMNLIKEKEEKVESKYVGNVGERREWDLKYLGSYGYNSAYGYCFIHCFEDQRGNAFIWSSGTEVNAELDSNVTILGTLKEHSEYKGTKQNILTRCKVKEI